MGLASTLARRSLLQRPARSLFSILGIAVGIATVVGVYALDHNTIEGLKEYYSDYDEDPESTNWRPELEVSPSPGVTDPRAELDAIDGVAGAAEFFQNEIILHKSGRAKNDERGRGLGEQVRLMAVEAEVLPRMDAYELLAGARLEAGSETPQVLIGSPIAEKLELSPGDRVELSRRARAAPRICIDGEMQQKPGATAEEPVVITFEVAGVLTREKLGRRANGEIVLIDLKWGERLFADAHTSRRYWVRPDPVANIEDLQARLADSFALGRSPHFV